MSCYACPRQRLPGSFGCALHQPRVTGPAPLLTVAPPLTVDVPVDTLPAPALSPWDVPTPRSRKRHGAGLCVSGCGGRPGPVYAHTPADVVGLCPGCRATIKSRAQHHRNRGTGVTRAEIVAMVRAGTALERGRPRKARA